MAFFEKLGLKLPKIGTKSGGTSKKIGVPVALKVFMSDVVFVESEGVMLPLILLEDVDDAKYYGLANFGSLDVTVGDVVYGVTVKNDRGFDLEAIEVEIGGSKYTVYELKFEGITPEKIRDTKVMP